MTQQSQDVHQVVQERYGAIARSGATSCCSPSSAADSSCCDSSAVLYDSALLEGLPVDVTNLSLGCGDPVTVASLREGEHVVDLGSGGGIDCFLAAKQVGALGYVIGIDMTPDMINRANQNKARMGARNVEFRHGNIEAMPVDSSSVDVVMSNCVINLSPDKRAVFGEAFRVLKPGGRVSISDIVTEGDFSEDLRAQVDKWAECVTGAIDVTTYTGMMRDAGFADIRVVDKYAAGEIVPVQAGMPRIFSARITARKP